MEACGASLPPEILSSRRKILQDLARLVQTRLLSESSESDPPPVATPPVLNSGSPGPAVTASGHEQSSVNKIQILLQEQKVLSSVEVEEETRHHGLLTAELAELTEVLKETTMHISASVSQQNLVRSHLQLSFFASLVVVAVGDTNARGEELRRDEQAEEEGDDTCSCVSYSY